MNIYKLNEITSRSIFNASPDEIVTINNADVQLDKHYRDNFMRILEALKQDRATLDAVGDFTNTSMVENRIQELDKLIAKMENVNDN